MRFADKGYYIEEYIKCANCGVLIYEQEVRMLDAGGESVYCSDWCREWAALRESDAERRGLPLPRNG